MTAIAGPRLLRDSTVDAIIVEATKRGAQAAPVFSHKGQIEEVQLFRDGALHSSISRPDAGRIWVWRPDRSMTEMEDIPEAVRVGLFTLQEEPRKRAA
jgi:hypothetical protein